MPNPFPDRYRAAISDAGGCCPIEAGVLGHLADHECAQGRRRNLRLLAARERPGHRAHPPGATATPAGQTEGRLTRA